MKQVKALTLSDFNLLDLSAFLALEVVPARIKL